MKAAYIMNGNCKNVMNMSQSDQSELWNSVMNGEYDPLGSLTQSSPITTF
ncbi:hypothetical protein V6N12_023091 [Hibiscus sabdariffa]|uniref:Autophagy protein ATG5 alpha-helical bundle region domain-containing protein n=1 Tax=Hibiscus sabdariffa TaxID=183260 RepID=A0ABR2FWT8_9ROSI